MRLSGLTLTKDLLLVPLPFPIFGVRFCIFCDRTGVVKIPRRWQELYTEGQKIRKELFLVLDRYPTDTEIARKLKVSIQEWQDSKLAAQNRITLSLDTTVVQQVDCPITLGEALPDPRSTTLQQQEDERQQLQGAMSQLEEKTRTRLLSWCF